jgi:Ca-activated chloride channel homolog
VSLRLESPGWLAAALVVVAALALELWARRSRRHPALRYPALPLVLGLGRTFVARTWWLPTALRLAAMACWVVALARPQSAAEPEERQSEGIDVLVALDVSLSMKAADFQPRDRMTVAKRSVADFVRQRNSDRIGLVLFAGQALSWVPPTLDYDLLLDLLDDVEAGMVPTEGTAIGSAIGTAVTHLEDSPAVSKAVVLITDGENNAGSLSPHEAADLAAAQGITVHTVAIGTGGEVPFPTGRDFTGRTVYQRVRVPVDRKLLADLASRTDGQAFVAEDGQELDRGLSAILDALERTRLASGILDAGWKDRFAPWIWAGLGLLAAEALLRFGRWRQPA